MPAITTTSDGAYIYLALQTGGVPIVVRCSRDDLSTFTAVYAPGVGSAINVAQVPSSPDQILFFGNMGSGVQVVSHVVSTGVETNISPTGLTTKIVNNLAVNPSDAAEIIAAVDTDQDLLSTVDSGAAWDTLNAALGFDAAALAVRWQNIDEYHVLYLGGQVTLAAALRYSPNTAESLSDVTGANLAAAAQIVGIEL